MASISFSPQYEVYLESVGGDEFVLEIGPHTANNYLNFTGGTGGTSFLPVADLIDESDPIYFYFGWISVDNGWLVQRQVRTSSLTSNALAGINSGVPDLASAWPLRVTLNYNS